MIRFIESIFYKKIMSFIPPESLEAAEANRRADQAYNAK